MPGVPPARYAYLGPEGTFTEQAARSLPAADRAELIPCTTVTVALDAVRDGEAAGAVVPIENSVEGSVPVTLDELATGEPLMITREITVPIEFSLLARRGTSAEAIRRVATHPHAAAQTRRWVATHLPHAEVVHTSSTAAAAAGLVGGGVEWDAAITAPLAASHYPLAVLANRIGDTADAETRFVLVTRPGAPAPPTGADKSSLVAFIRDDHPGVLLEMLEEFSLRGVNLSRIESRPTGQGLGRYCFSIDCEGHIGEARVGEALMGLHRMCDDVRFLGSYARVDGVRPEIAAGTGDADFREAERWLARLRDGH
ncbi:MULTISPECIES: prephenate dehydratase [unclassified Nocardioides]|uniref:prephenate dehydratase n=1 Tax=unclassified Nocardioides TaxID=2615069 RepID=UPI0007030419|nr:MULTISPECIES: prephenate dehydratase [unclassified Nocardioides]KQZ76102.1 prephenate dehydratase [Nocardioides sp. Root151]KRF20272.1 prephenate dehydratase [Nocardioides sp. Soil796]